MSGLHAALAALLREYRQSANPAPYTSERALVERAEALLAEHPPTPGGAERVEYAVKWTSNGPHPTRWVGQWSTFGSLEDAQRLAGYTHVHHPKILRRVTTATPWEPVEETQP